MISANKIKKIDIQQLKDYALKLPEPVKTLILSQPDEMDENDLISKFFEWRKILKIK